MGKEAAGGALVSEARRLDKEAHGHKGAIAQHKRALQDVRARQAQVEAQCAALGITVTYHPRPGQAASGSGVTEPKGEGTHPWPKRTPFSTSRR